MRRGGHGRHPFRDRCEIVDHIRRYAAGRQLIGLAQSGLAWAGYVGVAALAFRRDRRLPSPPRRPSRENDIRDSGPRHHAGRRPRDR